ncbi:phytochelatin synthase family protein [Pseudohaliea sp.]|uniref:phytochelatin synthase family protein n=1 Tax=Pseudohaliea sp. TaxID=2740289 RepID=UPI0032ED70FC
MFTIKRVTFALAILAFAPGVAIALDATAPTPKLAADMTPVTTDNAFLRSAEAPDYWAMSPFYLAQQTNAACSLASMAVAMNTLRGLPALAKETLVTQDSLLAAVADPDWNRQAAQDGDGVTFDDLVEQAQAGPTALAIDASVEARQPALDSTATLDAFRALLAKNEQSANDVVLVYYNQGVVTGDWDGPHVSPIGAYDAAKDRVLIMDVDREWYVPYWTATETLYKAMLKPTSAEHGVLEGEVGGWVRIARGD